MIIVMEPDAGDAEIAAVEAGSVPRAWTSTFRAGPSAR